jgi:diguanylate cyclase (GGDEF)-like protein/PAS domain S-box-containing protein
VEGGAMPDRIEFDMLRRIARVNARINSGQELHGTLQDVTNGVVEVLGFGCAALNYRLRGGGYEVMSVTGPPEAKEVLEGELIAEDTMDDLLARAERWGELRFVPHTNPQTTVVGWVPTIEPPTDDDGWHAEDMLLAPLRSADQKMVGVLSVDLPPDLRKPGQRLRELLEMFAVQAGIAIDNVRLRAELIAERVELRREQAHLRASDAVMRFSFDQSADGMARIGLIGDEALRFLEVNDAFCHLTGHSREELLTESWSRLLRKENLERDRRIVAEFVAGTRSSYRTELPIDRPDGTTRWLTVVENRVDSADDLPSFLLMHAQDTSERRFREQELRQRAHYDDLTGLANRHTLLRELEHVVLRAQAEPRPSALLFCDLNRFKPVNDEFGHAAGDRALQEVAERLLGQVRGDDMVGRLGGDEFVVIAKGVTEPEARDMADRIRAALTRPLTSVNASIGVSIGIATIDGADEPVEVLLQRADDAMYAEKDVSPEPDDELARYRRSGSTVVEQAEIGVDGPVVRA